MTSSNLQSLSNSEKPHPEFEYHLRIYQDADKEQLHKLFMNAMVWHSHSPFRPFLKEIARGSLAKALYAVLLLGIILSPWYHARGPAISAIALGGILCLFGIAFQMIIRMTRKSLKGDLNEIREHYELAPSEARPGQAVLQSSGPRAFWVVEATHRISGAKEIVGCGGIDIVQREGKPDVELRRVVVSGDHTRRGVAAMIIQAAIAHAKHHKLPSIYLSTSSVQNAAVQLYKKYGWVEEKRRAVFALGAKIQAVSLRLYLTEKSF